MKKSILKYSLLFNGITLSMMLLIIFEIAYKIELLLKMLGTELYIMMYIAGTDKGQILMDANFSDLTFAQKELTVKVIKEANDFFTTTSLISTPMLIVILAYLTYIFIRFSIKKYDSIKSYKIEKKYSDNKNIVFYNKSIQQIADSFKIFSKNYISIHPSVSTIKNENHKKFIIQHEIFHGKSYDTILKTILLSSYIFIPVFIFSFLSIPIFIEFFLKQININILNSLYYISYIFFSLIIIFNIYLYLNRKNFLSIFFHYKEYLADYYAYLQTNTIYRFNEKNEKTIYHPFNGDREKFLKGKKQLSIDLYIYMLTIIYISNISYQVPSLILITLLFIFFIFKLKHLYISLTCFLISTSILIISKVSYLFIFNENFEKDYSAIIVTHVIFFIILFLSYITSKFNTRRLL